MISHIFCNDETPENSLDFCKCDAKPVSPREYITVLPSLVDLQVPVNASGNYRFSHTTSPVFIIVSSDDRCSVAARFFCTRLIHFMRWDGESMKLFAANETSESPTVPRFSEAPDSWKKHVDRCVEQSLSYFDSNPTLGFHATPVSVIYMDCTSPGSFDAFYSRIPPNRSFLFRHIWFTSREGGNVRECSFIVANLETQTLQASRCRGSVVCSHITSFLSNLMVSLRRIYLNETLEGDPGDTLKSFTPIFFTRHGQSEYNLEDRLGGDPDLTDSGRMDATAIANFFERQVVSNKALFANRNSEWDSRVGFEVWCSQLRRTRHTAEPSAAVLTRGRLKVFQSLNEIHAGICEDMTNEEVKLIYPHIQSFRHNDKVGFRYPNGESYRDLMQRLTPLLLELGNKPQCVLVVAHQAVLRTILSFFGGPTVQEAVHVPCPQRTVWVCTYSRVGHPRLCEIRLPPRAAEKAKEKKWEGW